MWKLLALCIIASLLGCSSPSSSIGQKRFVSFCKYTNSCIKSHLESNKEEVYELQDDNCFIQDVAIDNKVVAQITTCPQSNVKDWENLPDPPTEFLNKVEQVSY